jgi:lipopolysaccharide transport system ATP-binding protein
MPVAIRVENVSKAYQLGEFSSGTLSRDLERWWALYRGKEDPFLTVGETNDRSIKGKSDIVWSLRNLNFEIQQGDAVGIIGKNGAGKSTLLKVLSQVTAPTTGKIKVKGRIASLLEVGTGFHPELTGRENIFLNGAILGMRKHEIARKFDEIVDFSGVERYIDTPVKRYSSGMYVRLAFAVAAHLESEILIVDEVLAVGDAEFQKKAIGKMQNVSHNTGRTVLFVSHNIAAVHQLCNKGLILKNGKLDYFSDVSKALERYLSSSVQQLDSIFRNDPLPGNYFKCIFLSDSSKKLKSEFTYEEEIVININVVLPNWNDFLELSIRLIDRNKLPVFTIHEPLYNFIKEGNEIGFRVRIPSNFVTPGSYSWNICINLPNVEIFDMHEDVLPFSIIDTGSKFAIYSGQNYGTVFAKYSIELG